MTKVGLAKVGISPFIATTLQVPASISPEATQSKWEVSVRCQRRCQEEETSFGLQGQSVLHSHSQCKFHVDPKDDNLVFLVFIENSYMFCYLQH